MDHVTDFHWRHEMQGVNRGRDHDASSMASGRDGPCNVDPRHDSSAENRPQSICIGRENDFCHGHGGLTGRLSGRCFHMARSSHIPRQKGSPAARKTAQDPDKDGRCITNPLARSKAGQGILKPMRINTGIEVSDGAGCPEVAGSPLRSRLKWSLPNMTLSPGTRLGAYEVEGK